MPARQTNLTAFGRRVMAAAILSGYDSMDELARLLSISGKTLSRTLAGKREITQKELGQLAEALAVPESFLREGFPEDVSNYDPGRLEELLARRHDQMLERLQAIEETLRELSRREAAAVPPE